MMKIFELKNNYSWHANSYILYDNINCVLIDPDIDGSSLIDFIQANHLNVKGIVLTHAHFDHITGVDFFKKKYNCPVYMHKNDFELLKDPSKNSSFMVGKEIYSTCNPEFVGDNDTLKLLQDDILIIHTPFHTEGSICLYVKQEGILISGDTLFKSGIGRCDLYGGNCDKINSSLNKLKLLPKATKVYPGHGPNTTIEQEL